MAKLWEKYSKEELSTFVNNSKNKKELASKIGYNIKSSSYIYAVDRMINFYNFDISHFENLRNQNLIGKVFGELTVLEKDKNKKITSWICECSCGKIISVKQFNLKDGNTKSCGCKRKEHIRDFSSWENLTGKKIGYWQVLGIDEEKSTNGTYWRCFCTLCGKTIRSIPTTNLKHNKTFSCGCHKSSLKTLIIEKFLEENNISYEKEYSFPDLMSESERPLKFDYKIEKENNIILIEYQGRQHYIHNPAWGDEEDFKRQQENDNKKRIYCKNKNIQLIEYDYTLSEKELKDKMEVDLL